MCVYGLQDWQVSDKDIIVHKICRVDRKGRYRSRIQPDLRSRQDGSNSSGTDAIYRLGKRKKSSSVGYYCYSSRQRAIYMKDRDDAVLKCVIPAGVRFRRGRVGGQILAKTIIPIEVVRKGKY